MAVVKDPSLPFPLKRLSPKEMTSPAPDVPVTFPVISDRVMRTVPLLGLLTAVVFPVAYDIVEGHCPRSVAEKDAASVGLQDAMFMAPSIATAPPLFAFTRMPFKLLAM